MKVTQKNGALSVSAYPGDAKMLLAFDLEGDGAHANLAGFTIQVTPKGHPSYFLWNDLQFAHPEVHAQVAGEPAYSTANAPLHKFRWVHVPGLDHQGLNPPYTDYSYTVTPRYFDADQHMLPLDATQSATVTAPLQPFVEGKLKLGFTRGFVQSQAFVHHFGNKLPVRPTDGPLDYDTGQQAGTDPQGKPFTYAEQYAWLGFTARDRVFELLDAVATDADATLDVFAYDLNEPDVVAKLVALGGAGKVRIILDDASLHHSTTHPKPEDVFTQMFTAKAGADKILRGKFGRYAHDKIFVLYRNGVAQTVLTGSTNFSVTGMYVNANHTITIDDPDVAALYAQVFAEAWADQASEAKFAASAFGVQTYPFETTSDVPKFDVTFSPHSKAVASARLGEIVDRCTAEAAAKGNVFFAVMDIGGTGDNPVYDALNQLHADPGLFSYGISDDPKGISYYPVGSATGVLVTGKPGKTQLPPPFDQVPDLGTDHQIHHKFVACGFGGADPVVYCGSSNLALGGEQANGDNLLAIHDDAVVTAFVIEALLLVDHFNFLDQTAKAPKGAGAAAKDAPPPADKRAAAANAGWYLGTTDAWVAKYYDPADLHYCDRLMFA